MVSIRPDIIRQVLSLGYQPDHRLIPARSDLAAAYLGREGVDGCEGVKKAVAVAWTGLWQEAGSSAPIQTQLLFGEIVTVYDESGEWAWVQAEADGSVGYVKITALSTYSGPATHKVVAPLAHLYPEADLKTGPLLTLPALSQIRLTEDMPVNGFRRLETGGRVFEKHIRSTSWHSEDWVEAALEFLHAPYLWGGKTAAGLDCSALLQISLALAGHPVLRDTDQQAATIGREEPELDAKHLKRGDIVFFPGHVGIMLDPDHLLHANATAMQVSIDPLVDVIGIAGKPTFRRLS